jgi:hypothetical protein
MSNTPLQPKFDLESLSQLPEEELVSIIVQQQGGKRAVQARNRAVQARDRTTQSTAKH